MSGPRLPFGFARENDVLLSDDAFVLGPAPKEAGLREALRIAGSDLPIVQTSEEDFTQRLTALHRGKITGPDANAGTDDFSEAIVIDGDAAPPTQRDLLDGSEEAPVIRLANHLFRTAVENSASDVHVEPGEGGLRVRMRFDGMLQTTYTGPAELVRRLVSRLKVMAGLDIAETRLPQDGHIPLRYGGRSVDVRISTLPGNYGERVVMRILDRTTGLLPLDQLGMTQDQVADLQRLCHLPHGIVLATGPTGSGKTTTLYSLLSIANTENANILTVEDPIEYDIDGINQSQIHAEIGLTFASGLRAALRQDPDVILVGEIRDAETAKVAAQAALTGHLVFSSLHANGSVAAISRLRDLGLADYLIAATVSGVIAQRLLRRLCPECAQAHPPNATQRAAFEATGLDVPETLRTAGSCASCRNQGYRGRFAVYEILAFDAPLRDLVSSGAGEAELRNTAVVPDQTLWGQALRKVAQGHTDYAEAVRVVGAAE